MDTNDPHRPRYHIRPPAGWLNDPNGLIHWRGQYHVFYQHNPHGAFHNAIHWGHAVSADLAHWEHWPIALAPDDPALDADGCWSGCALDDGGRPTLLYTGASPQRQCLAWSEDGLRTWRKHPRPVLAAPSTGQPLIGGGQPDWRDPWVWRAGANWFMLLGAGLPERGGAVLLYQSADLRQWNYVQPILVGGAPGEVWECPSLFPLDGEHVLLYSPIPEFRHTRYFSGAYAQHTFQPQASGLTDYGPYFYAAQTLLDERGRRLLWGWIKEGRPAAEQRAAGWSGALSLPRVLRLAADGALEMDFPPELAALRGAPVRREAFDLPTEPTQLLNGRQLEIQLRASQAQRLCLEVLAAPEGQETTRLICDRAENVLRLDRARASLNPLAEAEPHTLPLPAGAWDLRVFVDGSILEISLNQRLHLTTRVYPTRADSLGLKLSGQGRVDWVAAWPLDEAFKLDELPPP